MGSVCLVWSSEVRYLIYDMYVYVDGFSWKAAFFWPRREWKCGWLRWMDGWTKSTRRKEVKSII